MANTKKKEANLTTFAFMQDLLPEHWDWEPAELTSLGDCCAMSNVLLTRLQDAGLEVTAAYGITHDKDERELWSKYKNVYQTVLTSAHMHFVFKLSHGDTLENIAKIIGISPNYIEKPKRGRYAYDNMLSYLIHIKYPKKYQYDPHDVITIMGKDYIEYFQESRRRWMHGRAVRILVEAEYDLADLKRMIMDGEVTKADLLFNEQYKYTYQLHKKILDDLINRHLEYIYDRNLMPEGEWRRRAKESEEAGKYRPVPNNNVPDDGDSD